jgi:hypothetical protein
MVRLRSLLRGPFSFLFADSAAEERVVAYLVREHRRGRRFTEIVDDPFVRDRLSKAEVARLLDRPDLIHALGDDVSAERSSTAEWHAERRVDRGASVG